LVSGAKKPYSDNYIFKIKLNTCRYKRYLERFYCHHVVLYDIYTKKTYPNLLMMIDCIILCISKWSKISADFGTLNIISNLKNITKNNRTNYRTKLGYIKYVTENVLENIERLIGEFWNGWIGKIILT
jgi:hypothetical protein